MESKNFLEFLQLGLSILQVIAIIDVIGLYTQTKVIKCAFGLA